MPALDAVVLITCHDLGRHIGAYGAATVSTPNLDRLGAHGVVVTEAFSTSSSCSPSRASIATGRYPHSNGVMGLSHPPFGWTLAPGEHHIAALLAANGFETALFGFQHVCRHEKLLGFHHLYTDGPALAADLSSRFEAFIRPWIRDRPLYVEINFEEPHRPFDQGGVPPDTSRGVAVPAYLPQNDVARSEMAQFQGAVAAADRGVGRLVSALDQANLSDQTLLVFVADHGLAMPRAKCTLYDPGIEVACVYHWPAGGIAGGRRVAGLASHVDVLPTILEAAGINPPQTVQGASSLPRLLGRSSTGRREIFAEKTFHSYYDPMRAIRTRRHKLILNFEDAFAVEVPADIQTGGIFRSNPPAYHGTPHPRVELYDLEADPSEMTNLAGGATTSEIQADLEGRLRAWMEETSDPLLRGPIPSPSYEEFRKRWHAE